MALSGTYAFSLDGGDISIEVWERLGKTGETMSGVFLRSLRRSINLMFAEWSNRGINLWAIDNYTQTLTAAVSAFNMTSGSIDILEATIARSTVSGESLMSPISRDEYVALPIKTTSGMPNQYWVQRGQASQRVYIYPVPNAAATYTMSIWRLRQLQDFSAAAENPDVPYLWFEALISGAAGRMAVKWAPDRFTLLDGLAERSFNAAASMNTEKVPMVITIDQTMR